jgi:hypothetical protein
LRNPAWELAAREATVLEMVGGDPGGKSSKGNNSYGNGGGDGSPNGKEDKDR